MSGDICWAIICMVLAIIALAGMWVKPDDEDTPPWMFWGE